MALPPNFDAYPLVGPDQITPNKRQDGVDPSEILNYLFKKSFGIPNTIPYSDYANDSAGAFNSTPAIKNKYIYAQPIPDTAPSDLTTDGSWTVGTRQTSTSYPYLVYYTNVPMTSINGNQSFACYDTNGILFSNNGIPYFYGDGSSYNIILTANDTTILYFGQISYGSWLMDTDSGVLTFYDDVTAATVDAANPPIISFWRYEGLTGNANIVEVFDA